MITFLQPLSGLTTLAVLLLADPGLGGGPVVPRPRTDVASVDFERHVASVFTRLGCNTGACHGSFRGKGGFTLSLFGGSPDLDYVAVTRDGFGRRLNLADPENSLLLRKPSGLIPHGGGRRFTRDSWEYGVLAQWIAEGGRHVAGSASIRRLAVDPAEVRLDGPRAEARFRVFATFADASREDVTAYAVCRIRDDTVAELPSDGVVRARQSGSTALTISYAGAHAGVVVLVSHPARRLPPLPPADNPIDRAVLERLGHLNIGPSAQAGDAEFLRRVTIDTVGGLPSPEEVRSFLADCSADKRERKVEELLGHPRHAALWATRLCDMTACDIDLLEEPRSKRSKAWHDWFRTRIARNQPYYRIVEGVLCAESREGLTPKEWVDRELRLDGALSGGFETEYAQRRGLDLYWRRVVNGGYFPTTQMAELTAAAFLGVRIGCAQCHKHPTDRWTQQDYRGFTNVFAQVKYGMEEDLLGYMTDLLEERRKDAGGSAPPFPRLREVYVNNANLRRLPDPRTGERLPPKAPGGPRLDDAGDVRRLLVRWLVRTDNSYFAPNFVNRVWKAYFGEGLVEPVDGFSASNPPSNPALLQVLSNEFVDNGFNIRHVERLILRSRTYQLSSVPNDTNFEDRNDFSRHYPRRPMAEVIVDMLNDAIGAAVNLGPDVPPGTRAVEVAPSKVQDPQLAGVFETFGRPKRKELCDCERRSDPVLTEKLFLLSNPGLLERIRNGRVARLCADGRPDREVVEELFLATLSRQPADKEEASVSSTAGAVPTVALDSRESFGH